MENFGFHHALWISAVKRSLCLSLTIFTFGECKSVFVMSDRVARSYDAGEGTSERASYPCESVWMAHWMSTTCKSETKACGHVSIHYEDAQQNIHDFRKHACLEGLENLTESSKETRKERWEGQSFPMFSLPPKISLAKQGQPNSTVHAGVLSESNSPAMPAWALQATPSLPGGQLKYHNFLENNSPAVSESFPDELMRSDSEIVPHQFKGGSTSLPSFMCREEEINHSNSLLAPRQNVRNTINHSSSTLLAHERNINDNSISRRSEGSLSRQNDAVLVQHDPSKSSKQKPDFVGKNFWEMQNQSGIGLLPSSSSPQEVTKLENVYQGYCSRPSLQRSVHNMDTMRICATVNAEEELSGGAPKFSNTIHHFLFSKNIGVNLSEGDQPGFKLLPYRSCTDSEGEEDVRDVKAPAVESSSETDIMGMDAFQDNLLPGVVASSPSDKYLFTQNTLNVAFQHVEKGEKSPTSQSAFTSGREEIGARLTYTKLFDINQVAPFASSAEERETSTSKTQSLDVEHLLSHAEQPTNSKSIASPEGPQGPEPGSRWVKRLKLSASQSAHGTKSSKMGEASSHEKVNKFSNRIMKCGITSSQPSMGRFLGKEQMALDQTATLLRNGKSSSIDSGRKFKI
ncbi:F-box family protein [Prunus dulcis]|uniref:F-box family protein n=1 Tax=Prunus dulcis TaxID=3755 RepID=A0A4Y1S007_PRUDU|nr:F-box family protein [Prunus dulcis]